MIAYLHWLTVMLAHTTIAVARSIRTQIEDMPWTTRKIEVIYNGIPSFSYFDRQISREYLMDSYPALPRSIADDIWVGSLSELHKSKGLDYAIEAMAELVGTYPTLRFIVAGEGEERAALEVLVAKHGLAANVFLLGYVPGVARYLKAFDALTLTSRTEMLPYVLLEAGLTATPAIASAVGGIPEIITDKKHGLLVEPGDVTAIRDALDPLLSNKKLRAEVSAEFFIGEESVKHGLLVEPGDVTAIRDALDTLLSNKKLRADLGAALKAKISSEFTL